jgi:hypothetical protein
MKRKFVDMLNIGMHLPNNKHLQKLYNKPSWLMFCFMCKLSINTVKLDLMTTFEIWPPVNNGKF